MQINPKPVIPIIIVNYKTSQLVKKLINTLQEDKIGILILILDNESTEESYTTLKEIKDERVKIFRSKINLGFTGGTNYLIQFIIDNIEGIKYFFLLNPDAFSCPNLISDLFSIIVENKNVACISPKILHIDGSNWYSGAKINFNSGKVFNNSIPEKSKDINTYEVDVFSGCAVLFDLQKVREAGMFNEKLFMYYDEVDLSLKIKKLGYKILYSPHKVIYHDVSYTTQKISFLKTYYMTRNRFIVLGDHMKLINKFVFLLHDFLYHIKNKRFKNAYYHILGYIHFLKAKSGKFI